ncbi:hypothetical protein NF717_03930 [Lactococcus formosensis]|uniref:Uncharacterized protein n=1 Tax=Lactococcus formosensis TaxID=1281486 RepID=A0A9X4NZV3_9LACT|nr:hypothetical protein [Lactococcus formosensis]MDG6134513.1 hypothetical protein [Lactococcus formosensis]MDG6144813.1 hypothetical protein [Lactococcus formosensis]MDG6176861.1 hypothetical protein [Lactococcus formosensis]
MIFLLLLIKNQAIRAYKESQYFFPIRKKRSLINWKLEVENIRRASLEAYLLLESLVAMSLLVFFVTVVLEQVIQVKKRQSWKTGK